jgi:hypothetical protein
VIFDRIFFVQVAMNAFFLQTQSKDPICIGATWSPASDAARQFVSNSKADVNILDSYR